MVPPAFSAAQRRRDPLRVDGATNALRVLDGAGDGREFAGLILEDYAGRWLVQTDDTFLAAPPAWLREVKPAPRSIYWKRLQKSDRNAPIHWHGQIVAGPFAVRENGVVYRIDFSAGYSQGIFLDQRDNRLRGRQRAAAGAQRVLNLFSYTCAFSVAAALGGAITVSVDLSKRYLEWGRQNFLANDLDPAAHEFWAGDVFDRLRLMAKQQRRFDVVIADPPTFSRNRQGRIFRVERDYDRLARLAASLVAAGGWLLCSTNHRGLRPGGLHRSLSTALGPAWRLEDAAMPPDFTGDQYLQSVWARRTE